MTSDPPRSTRAFDHDRLQVYEVALGFTTLAHTLLSRLPRTKSASGLADQLERAARSIPLNIAEGSGEFSAAEKVKFYRYALRSASECAAILDVVTRFYPMNAKLATDGKAMLHRITAMLLALIRRHEARAEG